MDEKQKWIMLVYRLPRGKTSAAKVALWRKLKKIGVFQIQDSVCILPLSDKNMENFQWTAAEVSETGGDASVWVITAISPDKEKEARDYFLDQVNVQYQALIRAVDAAVDRENLKDLWLHFNRIKSQDYLKSPLSVEVKAAFERRMAELGGGNES